MERIVHMHKVDLQHLLYAKFSSIPHNIMSGIMSTDVLELVSAAAVEKLGSRDDFSGVMSVDRAYSDLRKAIKAYESRNWTQSAALFIKVWRYSELAVSNHLEEDISMDNIPDSLDEALSWDEKTTCTIGWLGIFALHDAATAFFQAGDSSYDAGDSKYVGGNRNVRETKPTADAGKETIEIKSGLFTDRNYNVGGEIFEAGAPLSTIVPALDKIGRIYQGPKTCYSIAHGISVLCLRCLRMTDTSRGSLLSTDLHEKCWRMIMSNMTLVTVYTVSGEKWAQHAGLRSLRMAKELINQDSAWGRLLEDTLKSASVNPLSIMVLESKLPRGYRE